MIGAGVRDSCGKKRALGGGTHRRKASTWSGNQARHHITFLGSGL
ncbi:hypothetical protein RCO48_15605 [Peribacillus frigoritolerans]|nr:hypothetical protein [Peribacillus frigoritolerans]